MTEYSRRDFLQRVAALSAAGVMPASIARALTLPTPKRSGSLADIEHVVILMQENRSFDHYFGRLRGVRGFDDPRAMQLRDGRPVWQQRADDGRPVLPFALDSHNTRAPMMKSLDHSWKGSHGQDPVRWRDHDVWIRYKGEMTMGYFDRRDIPYYYALADAFTVCDGYYCSLHGPTNPNRMYLFTGTSGLAVGNDGPQVVDNADDGNWTGDMSRDKSGYAAMQWTTYAERLQQAGVSWKVYQEYDNFGDNSLAYFATFRDLDRSGELYLRGRACVPGSTAENAVHSTADHLVSAFANDVQHGNLPQVSWIVAPYAYCEHPEATPAYGESLVSRLIDALTANPEVWARTALIINYDENDGFFDHVPAPLPALDEGMGYSAVDTRGESYRGASVGLGVRVPLLVVSPWTRGGWVNSQVFDHTSVLRLLEARFGIAEPNITSWRRAVTGDLTSVFDFAHADESATHALPSVGDYLQRMKLASGKPEPRVPDVQRLPRQEPGQRPARALPYALEVHAEPEDVRMRLRFVNHGKVAVVFNVYARDAQAGPWYYTLQPGTEYLAELPGLPVDRDYALAVHGPNGFLREFAGGPAKAEGAMSPGAWVRGGREDGALTVQLGNAGPVPCELYIRALDYLDPTPQVLTLQAGEVRVVRFDIAASDHWYDLLVEQPGGGFRRRLAGHLETGKPSRSDPAIGRVASDT